MESIAANAAVHQQIHTLLFARDGMLRVAPHDGGQLDGHPVIELRGLAIRLTTWRHTCVCLALGALGLGLVAGHTRGRPRGLGNWILHDWRVIVQNADVPREWRRNIVFVGATPLLPLGRSLYFEHRERLALRSRGDDELVSASLAVSLSASRSPSGSSEVLQSTQTELPRAQDREEQA